MTSNADNRPRTAFVTGASRGIGRATAIALAEAGHDVAVSARTLTDGSRRLEQDEDVVVPGGLDTTVAEIEARGQRGVPIVMDLLDRASVLAAADKALATLGHVDVLVNNGIYQGPGAMTPVLEIEDAEEARMFEGNVFAQLAIIKRVLPAMIEHGGGTVVNMISATAYQDPPAPIGEGGWGMAYAMTKAAFERVAPLLKNEHEADGVVAFSVDPGFVVTERLLAAKREGTYGAHFRGATPEVIAAAIRWLVTDPEAAEQSGQIIYAQREVKRRGLLPGWPPPKPAS